VLIPSSPSGLKARVKSRAVGAETAAAVRQSDSSTCFMPSLKRSAAPSVTNNVGTMLSFQETLNGGCR
jgi:hypothetical protein